jgi:phage gpG-like protein
MSFQAGFNIRDGISPALAALTRRMRDKKPVLEAMGQQLVSITQRAFSDESMRVSPWAPRKGTTMQERTMKNGLRRKVPVNGKGLAEHQLLRKSGALFHSIRITSLTNESVTAGSDRVYAAIQQLGSRPGKTPRIPPRPFFPFHGIGRMADFAKTRIINAAHAKLRSLIGK